MLGNLNETKPQIVNFIISKLGVDLSDYLSNTIIELIESFDLSSISNENILIVDFQERILFWNTGFVDVFGIKSIKKNQKWQECFQNGMPYSLKKIAKEGSYNYVSYHNLNYQSDSGLKKIRCCFYPLKDSMFIVLQELKSKTNNLVKLENNFSFNYVNELTGGNKELMAELLTVFVEQCEQQLQLVEELVEHKNFLAISKIAHKLSVNFQIVDRKDILVKWKEVESLSVVKNESEKFTIYLYNLIVICKELISDVKLEIEKLK